MRLRGKHVLVTGGAGFIGSHLVDRILEEEPGHLVVVDSFFLGTEENLIKARKTYPGLKVYDQDAAHFTAMRRILEGEEIQVVFDLAVIPLPTSLERPHWSAEKNFDIVNTLCELARLGVFETLVHCSSSEAYGGAQYVPMDEAHPLLPATPYAASKAAGDHLVLSYYQTFGIDASIVRPFNNFGPRQNAAAYAGVIPIAIERGLAGEPMTIFGDGEQTRDFVFVRDTAEALVRTYEEEMTRGKVVNVASGRETSINVLISAIFRVMGIPDHPVTHLDPRPGDIRRHCGAIQLAQELIGFQPSLMTDEQLGETVEWYHRR
jgi:UDP-glucose 4-epimerase